MCGLTGILDKTPVGEVVNATADDGIKGGIKAAKNNGMAAGVLSDRFRKKTMKSTAAGALAPSPSTLMK